MSLSFSTAESWREVAVHVGNVHIPGDSRTVLVLRVPYHMEPALVPSSTGNLKMVISDCLEAYEAGSTAPSRVFDDFRVISLERPEDIESSTLGRALRRVVDYVAALYTGKLGDPEQFTFEFLDEQVRFSSKLLFRMEAKGPDGDFDLTMDYPAYLNGARVPQIEIKAFLAALHMAYAARCVGGHSGNVVIEGCSYDPIGGGFGFHNSRLIVTSRAGVMPKSTLLVSFFQTFLISVLRNPDLHD